MIFTLVHVSCCQYSQLIMCSCVDIYTWSCITMLQFSLGHVYLYCYAHFAMCPQVDSDSWSCIPMFDILTWSCVQILILKLIMYHYIDIDIWSPITLLLFSLGHGFQCWYWHLIKSPCVWFPHFVMYFYVDIHTCSSTPVLWVIAHHVSQS